MPAMSATPPPRTQDASIILLHDARAVHDTASIRYRDFVVQGEPTWIVAGVSPGARAGSGIIPGASIDADKGKLRMPDNATPELLKEGTWKAVASSSDARQPASGMYASSEPVGRQKRILEPEDYYSPFLEGGTVIFKPVAGATGMDQFASAHLLFDDWGKFVGPTFEYLATHPEVSSGGDLTPDLAAQLSQILLGKNPLLALLVFRHLQEARQLRATQVSQVLNSSSTDLVAGVCYLLLATPSLDERNLPLTEVISSHVKSTSEVSALRPIGLGAYAVALFASGSPVTLGQTKSMLAALRDRTKVLGSHAQDDRYLNLIFEKVGVPH